MVQPLRQSNVFRPDADRTGKTHREPAQLHRKNEQEQQAQPEGRHRRQQVADFLQDLIRPFILEHTHKAAQSKADDASKQPGADHQRQRVGKPFRNHIRYRPAKNSRMAQVTPE